MRYMCRYCSFIVYINSKITFIIELNITNKSFYPRLVYIHRIQNSRYRTYS